MALVNLNTLRAKNENNDEIREHRPLLHFAHELDAVGLPQLRAVLLQLQPRHLQLQRELLLHQPQVERDQRRGAEQVPLAQDQRHRHHGQEQQFVLLLEHNHLGQHLPLPAVLHLLRLVEEDRQPHLRGQR